MRVTESAPRGKVVVELNGIEPSTLTACCTDDAVMITQVLCNLANPS